MIAAGWYVVYRNSLKIEARKEAREFVDHLDGVIDSLHRSIIRYYCENEQHTGDLSSSIKAEFLLISHYLFLLKGLGINFTGGALLTNYRKAATGMFFETVEFKKQRDIPNWEAEVASLAAQLKLALRRAYFSWSCLLYTSPSPRDRG